MLIEAVKNQEDLFQFKKPSRLNIKKLLLIKIPLQGQEYD
jgi:hypothetical protein